MLAEMSGRVIRAEDPGFDAACELFNAGIDTRPRLVAQCHVVADVVSALEFARAAGLPVSVRSGGHGVHGRALVKDGVTIDLRLMKGTLVDGAARTVWAQSGLTWGELYKETLLFGMSTNGGAVASVGIGGLSQGSGNGWLMRLHGLTIDNIVAMQVVLASGEVVMASADSHPSLYWALRGGVGNFGVVTAFQYRLHPVPPQIIAGTAIYPLYKSRDVLTSYREYFDTAPDAASAVVTMGTMPDDGALPSSIRGKPAIAITMAWLGPLESGESALRPLRHSAPADFDSVTKVDLLQFLTSLDDTATPRMRNYWQGRYLHTLNDEAIDVFVNEAEQSPNTVAQVQRLGGAVDRASEDGAAYCRVGAKYFLGLPTLWAEAKDTERHVQRTRSFAEAMAPYTARVCLNHVSDVSEEQLRHAFGPSKYQRLVKVKSEYDPKNVFSSNLNIRPGSA